MASHKLRELVKAANPVPAPSRLLPQDEDINILFEEVMNRARNPQASTGLLDATVERGRNMDTEQTPLRVAGTPEPPPRRHWNQVLVGAAAFAVVVIVGVAVLLVTRGNDEPDVGNGMPTPLEVGEAMNRATVAGDLEAQRNLYDDAATFTDVMASTGLLLRASPAPIPDFDGDEVITMVDEILWDAAHDYAAGVTLAYTCNQTDPSTVVCEGVFEGHAFLSETSDQQVTNTFTVEDGLITHHQFDASPNHFAGYHNEKLEHAVPYSERVEDPRTWNEYLQWVKENHPETGNLFWVGHLTPDNVETHRELIAEWRAQS
jgi:hypothetical protein